MRLVLFMTVFGVSLGGLCLPVMAQVQQQQQQGYVYNGGYNNGGMPLYNAAPSYQSQTTGNSFYNSGANLQMLPMQQMTAGKNAPSYSFGGNRSNQPYAFNPYNGGLDPTAGGALTPDQARAIRAQRNAQAAAYQQEYLDSLRQRDMNNPYAQQQLLDQPVAGSMYQGGQFSQLYNENNQPTIPVKRKVLYKQLKNPLVEPPRLFNPDQ